MRTILLALLLVALAGCRTEIVSKRFDENHNLVSSVTFSSPNYSRGCLDVIVKPDGQIWATYQNDASSDWILGRTLQVIGPDIARIFVSPITIPLNAIMGNKTEPPSEIHGCGGMFEGLYGGDDEPDEPDDTEEG